MYLAIFSTLSLFVSLFFNTPLFASLRATILHDLRQNQIQYNRGSFPFEENQDNNTHFTPCCEMSLLKNIEQAESYLNLNDHPQTLELIVSDNDRCQLIPRGSEPFEETVLRRVRIGKDGRERILSTTQWPYSIHGHMIIRFSNGKEYVGSGTMVGPHHVLTAGHNIYSHKIGEGWATKVTFVPGKDEDLMPFGQSQGAILLSVENWTVDQDRAYDMGMVILEEPLGYKTGWGGIFFAPDFIINKLDINVTGYPGDKGEGHKKGTQMWTMGHFIKSSSDEQIYYDIDTYPGQSGSGIWSELNEYKGFYISAIHTYGENFHNKGNSATRLSYTKFKRLVKWMKCYQLNNFIHPYLSSNFQNRVIRRYEKGITKRSQDEIQLEIDKNKKWKGFIRQRGTKYERRTWAQWLIGRNEDPKIEALQARGIEVSTSLSTGRNFLNLAEMVNTRDQAIRELNIAGKVLITARNAEHEVFEEKERSFEMQKQLYKELKREKEARIGSKNDLIQLLNERNSAYIIRLINMIKLIDQAIEIPNPMTLKLGETITILENLIREKL